MQQYLRVPFIETCFCKQKNVLLHLVFIAFSGQIFAHSKCKQDYEEYDT